MIVGKFHHGAARISEVLPTEKVSSRIRTKAKTLPCRFTWTLIIPLPRQIWNNPGTVAQSNGQIFCLKTTVQQPPRWNMPIKAPAFVKTEAGKIMISLPNEFGMGICTRAGHRMICRKEIQASRFCVGNACNVGAKKSDTGDVYMLGNVWEWCRIFYNEKYFLSRYHQVG